AETAASDAPSPSCLRRKGRMSPWCTSMSTTTRPRPSGGGQRQARAGAPLVYLNEHDGAAETKRRVEATGRRCATFAGDIGQEAFCREVVERTVAALGQLDILVNNAAEQHTPPSRA